MTTVLWRAVMSGGCSPSAALTAGDTTTIGRDAECRISLLGTRLGWQAEVRFLGDLAGGDFVLEPVHAADPIRIAELVARSHVERFELLPESAITDFGFALVLREGYGWPLDQIETWIAATSRTLLLRD